MYKAENQGKSINTQGYAVALKPISSYLKGSLKLLLPEIDYYSKALFFILATAKNMGIACIDL